MIQHGAEKRGCDTEDEVKKYIYPVYTRNGYRLVAITDDEKRAIDFIDENDNHVRKLFYMKKRVTEPIDILNDMDASKYEIEWLQDGCGYELPAERNWTNSIEYTKVEDFVDKSIFDLFSMNGDLLNVLSVLNLPDEVHETLRMTSNILTQIESIFIDEDAMERISEIYQYISYDKVADMVFDYHEDHGYIYDKYKVRRVGTIL